MFKEYSKLVQEMNTVYYISSYTAGDWLDGKYKWCYTLLKLTLEFKKAGFT